MNKKNKGVTLIELLIVVLFLSSAALIIMLMLNPKRYIGRATDAKKISQLDRLKKALEEFYNDHQCYPKPQEICYGNATTSPCYICGKEPTSPNFSPYMQPLICDPSHPTKKIMYKVDNLDCPKWFKVFIDFEDDTNPNNLATGCGNGGCGNNPNYGYDYAVTSPNANLVSRDDITVSFFCYTTTDSCDNCGTSESCSNDPTCKEYYPSFYSCCQRSPKPRGCP